MGLISDISHRSSLLKWKRLFGPRIKCPECLGLMGKCSLCNGSGEVIQEDVDAWNNPVTKTMREKRDA